MSKLFSMSGVAKALSLTAVLALSTAMPAHAASVCKGKSSTACQASASCSYVKAHTRSNGVKVKSFCRAKSGKSKTTKSTTKSSAKKSSLIETDSTPTSTTKTSTAKKSKAKKSTAKKSTAKKSSAKKSTSKSSTAKKKTTK